MGSPMDTFDVKSFIFEASIKIKFDNFPCGAIKTSPLDSSDVQSVISQYSRNLKYKKFTVID